MKLILAASAHTTVSREAESDDQWDRDDTSTSWSVYGLVISDNKPTGYGSEEIDVPDDFCKVDDILYAVYAVYSDGDSFGRDDGHNLEFIMAYKSKEAAEKAKKILESCKDYNCEIELENGKTLTFGIPWNGYFESLDYINVEEFQVH